MWTGYLYCRWPGLTVHTQDQAMHSTVILGVMKRVVHTVNFSMYSLHVVGRGELKFWGTADFPKYTYLLAACSMCVNFA